MAFSSRRERRVSDSVGLTFSASQGWGDWQQVQARKAREGELRGYRRTYLPLSKEGEAMGESSVVMVKMPSKRRSGKGWVTSAEMLARTLEILGCTFQGCWDELTSSCLIARLRRRILRRK